ncbi:MAG TPA: SDR family NAD(P)-dependent oxidoreductase [Opitutaceae bacterium]|nr:SDR family NAD(P)-dependent oxidoreductase [Opitutaceae bacterium]
MSNVLVTGAAGFIGSHTCEALLARGHGVVGVDNFRSGKRENLAAAQRHASFRFVEGDVAGPDTLRDLVRDTRIDAIIHLAALVSVPQSITEPDENFRLNVLATQRVVDAARQASAALGGNTATTKERVRVVFASSAAVYGDNPELPLTERSETRPISPYGGAKLASEALLLGQGAAYGFSVRCLRYFNVFGPRQDPKSPYSGVISIFCDRLRAKAAPAIFGDGGQTRDFVSVHDVARANTLAATTPGLGNGVTNICTGKPTSLNQLAAVLGREFAGAPAPRHADERPGDIRHSLGSPDRARAELGFTAEVSLETGLRELVRSQ